MGYQLWISPKTGIRRKGTTFKELQSIFIEKITTKLIYEPIYCCRLQDFGLEVKDTLENRDFDVIGVIDENEIVIGYALREELGDNKIEKFVKKIESKNITTVSTPILELINILSINQFSFVVENNNVVGIVTRADINKPIVRIYIFGIITLFELHINFWITEFHKDNFWQEKINTNRLNLAINIFEKRKGNNEELTLLECAQLCDKREILKRTDDFINIFEFSKKRFERLLKDTEVIRNELAHSQNSIIANLDWNQFLDTISNIESFLHKSEKIVGEKARNP